MISCPLITAVSGWVALGVGLDGPTVSAISLEVLDLLPSRLDLDLVTSRPSPVVAGPRFGECRVGLMQTYAAAMPVDKYTFGEFFADASRFLGAGYSSNASFCERLAVKYLAKSSACPLVPVFL